LFARHGECAETRRRALVEAVGDPNEPLLPPKRIEKYAKNPEKALENGTKGSSQIRAALQREPYASQLHP
jgi:pyruvate dehydrogenase (quinone)